ncbi:2-(R)-hydroxypropyl-CoM dehydrogenase [Cytospora mali]|nr:2-(R)-hydroxypropyl-CoM dehydrogenase [Valsa mali var. pyri (nom. inval.)]
MASKMMLNTGFALVTGAAAGIGKETAIAFAAVNSAGLGNISGAVTPHLKLDIFTKSVDTNIKGAVYFVRAVTAAMAAQDELMHVSSRHGSTRSLGRGSIVLLGSVNSYIAAPGMLNYTTSKHAIIGITKSAAIDCVKPNIRVNAVCPSWVDTPMNQASLQRVPQLEQVIKAISPLQRVATVEEVADYILFLCSPSASYINGTHRRSIE